MYRPPVSDPKSGSRQTVVSNPTRRPETPKGVRSWVQDTESGLLKDITDLEDTLRPSPTLPFAVVYLLRVQRPESQPTCVSFTLFLLSPREGDGVPGRSVRGSSDRQREGTPDLDGEAETGGLAPSRAEVHNNYRDGRKDKSATIGRPLPTTLPPSFHRLGPRRSQGGGSHLVETPPTGVQRFQPKISEGVGSGALPWSRRISL